MDPNDASNETPTAGPADARELPADAPTPIDPNFRITVPGFEGPLDLLLFLIKKHELDVLDLPIAFIAKAYTDYLALMQQLNLDVAAEYLVMAATLAHIKSKSLLPKPPADQDDDDADEVDPREELIRRLLEYQKYKRVAEQLGGRGIAGRDVFPRGIPAPKAQGDAPLAEVSVFKLIDMFQKILKRHDGELAFEIDAERISIQERMGQITELAQRREKVPFEELFDGFATTYDLVVTFLALLEMAKMRMMRVYQSTPDGPIYIEARIVPVGEDGFPETIDEPAEPKQDAETETSEVPAEDSGSTDDPLDTTETGEAAAKYDDAPPSDELSTPHEHADALDSSPANGQDPPTA